MCKKTTNLLNSIKDVSCIERREYFESVNLTYRKSLTYSKTCLYRI